MAIVLKNSTGVVQSIDEGESAVITATFKDRDGSQLEASSITSLTMSLFVDPCYDPEDKATIINSRDNVDIRSSLEVDGTLLLKLTPEDNAIIYADNKQEDHIIRLTWTWINADVSTLTGIAEYYVTIVNLDTTYSG